MYNNTTWHIFTFAVSIAALCLITFFAVVCCCCCSCVFHEHQPHREGGYDETQQTYILYYFHNIIPRRIFIYFILHIIFLLYICHGRLCFHPPFLCWNVFFCIPHSLTVSDVKQWMLFFFSHFGHDSSVHNRHNTGQNNHTCMTICVPPIQSKVHTNFGWTFGLPPQRLSFNIKAKQNK